MFARLPLEIHSQPDDTTCGPTCLHAIYRYHGDRIGLKRVIDEVTVLKEGGTMGVFLACHALRRGYRATIQTYNLQMFDPTWFEDPSTDLRARLSAQAKCKRDSRLYMSTRGYLEFLELGGIVRFGDLTSRVIRKYLLRGTPILTGLSATYLYRTCREYGDRCLEDDVRGLPVGHFVVLCGYDRKTRKVMVADPNQPNPLADGRIYSIAMERVLGAIFLGAITYDGNLLMLEPAEARVEERNAGRDGRGS